MFGKEHYFYEFYFGLVPRYHLPLSTGLILIALKHVEYKVKY